MGLDRAPAYWSPGLRYGAALVAGLAWGPLWFGLHELGLPPLGFWIVSLVLFGPVFAALAHHWWDLGASLALAYAASIGSSLLPYHLFLDAFPENPKAWLDLAGSAAAAWAPTWIGAALLYWARLRARARGRL